MPRFDFNGGDLARLKHLMYSPGVPTIASSTGVHRARRAGQGARFLDYRRYVPGDDVRRIDWTVFARLRQPFIRVIEHEEVLFVTILIDLSRSMDSGTPLSKAALACQLACGLGYIALSKGDRLTCCISCAEKHVTLPTARGPATITRLVRSLRERSVGGATDLEDWAISYCRTARHRGLVIIISDFLNAGSVEGALDVLLSRRFKILAFQILSDADWAKEIGGPLRLIDSESGRTMDILATPESIAAYQECLRCHNAQLETYCLHRGQYYAYAQTDDNYLEVLARELRQNGLLQ